MVPYPFSLSEYMNIQRFVESALLLCGSLGGQYNDVSGMNGSPKFRMTNIARCGGSVPTGRQGEIVNGRNRV
jgi:hypothetical protein